MLRRASISGILDNNSPGNNKKWFLNGGTFADLLETCAEFGQFVCGID